MQPNQKVRLLIAYPDKYPASTLPAIASTSSETAIDRKRLLNEISRKVDFNLCLTQADEPVLLQAARIDEASVLKSIYLLTYEFIGANFPDTNNEAISEQFARDVLEVNATWSILDVVNFFKWIRQNQGDSRLKVYGNKINGLQLLEFSSYYNEKRAEIHELLLIESKQGDLNKGDDIDQATADKIRDEINAELRDLKKEFAAGSVTPIEFRRRYSRILGKKPAPTAEQIKAADHLQFIAASIAKKIQATPKGYTAAEINGYHKDNEFCIAWLKENQVPEDLVVKWFHLFLIRKR